LRLCRTGITPRWNARHPLLLYGRGAAKKAGILVALRRRGPGIDEHTALTLDPTTQQGAVSGAGQVTVRYSGRETVYPAGATLSFAEMRSVNLGARSDPAAGAETAAPTAPTRPEYNATTLYLGQLARAMKESGEPNTQRELIDHAHETMHELARDWQPTNDIVPAQDYAPMMSCSFLCARTARSQAICVGRPRSRSFERVGDFVGDGPNGTQWKAK